MSVEQYLALDDEEIQFMISKNCGSTASSPWCGSAVKKIRTRERDENLEVDKESISKTEEDELDEETSYEDSPDIEASSDNDEDDITYLRED